MRKPPTVRIESRGGKAMTFFVPLWFRRSEAREFRWKGRLLAFSVACRSLERGTKAGFETMNLALKQRIQKT